MVEASDQLTELLEDLALAARIEGNRWEPVVRDADSLELAQAAAERLGEGIAAVSGEGATVSVEPDATERSLYHLARCALRHGGLTNVELEVRGEEVAVGPVTPQAAPILLGEDLRDLGAAVGVRAVRALGGSVEVDGERLRIRLPRSSVDR